MSIWLQSITLYHNIYFLFYMLFVSPKFAWKSQISQLHELIARWQRKRMSPPGDQNMHHLQLFSTPWKLCRVVKTKTCREKKENIRRQWNIEHRCSIYVITHDTISFRRNRTAMGDNTVTGHGFVSLPGYSASVLPRARPFSEGGTPCPFLVTPCPFQKAEMMPCPFLVTPNDALLHFT